ncbi:MAG: cupin domain-containing protein [Candidatus Vogelbacteria bacterium]|nr:cupin domain-containing protein [Candidatus Vogelbacteria bacterium]
MQQEIGDAVTVAGHLDTIISENDRVRILDVKVPPGAVAEMHSHPDNIIVVLDGGTLNFTNPEGVTKSGNFAAGQAFFSPGNIHKVENKGDEEVHVIQIELKQ